MMVGEMATAKRLGVPVVFVLLTDHHLSLIGVKQQRNDYATYGTPLHGDGYDSPRTFFGVPVLEAHDATSYRMALDEALLESAVSGGLPSGDVPLQIGPVVVSVLGQS